MGTVTLNDLLKITVERGASDLHLKVGIVPMLRLSAELAPAPGGSRLTHTDLMAPVRASATGVSPGPRSGR